MSNLGWWCPQRVTSRNHYRAEAFLAATVLIPEALGTSEILEGSAVNGCDWLRLLPRMFLLV